ncbi:unnamed protein product [Ostreobium quekettii]|uniref:Uncharacterized protein n=1 Tax=Ostreobium quekettii TaxID=121088 RepID=A0A8S1JDA6_9CHLO|nr:unnamed protein product [Ostreobium quekettii]
MQREVGAVHNSTSSNKPTCCHFARVQNRFSVSECDIPVSRVTCQGGIHGVVQDEVIRSCEVRDISHLFLVGSGLQRNNDQNSAGPKIYAILYCDLLKTQQQCTVQEGASMAGETQLNRSMLPWDSGQPCSNTISGARS